MKKEHRKVLRVLRKELMDNGISLENYLLAELEARMIITPLERRKVEEKRPGPLGVGLLLDLLANKGDDNSFEGFCQALEDDEQRPVAKKLRAQSGESILSAVHTEIKANRFGAKGSDLSRIVSPLNIVIITSIIAAIAACFVVPWWSAHPDVPQNNEKLHKATESRQKNDIERAADVLGTIGNIEHTFGTATGTDGQISIEGRLVRYSIKGRIRKLKLVYDAYFTDVDTNIKAESKGWDSKDGAFKHGREELLAQLKSSGVLHKKT